VVEKEEEEDKEEEKLRYVTYTVNKEALNKPKTLSRPL
jgi:hypothetical protein